MTIFTDSHHFGSLWWQSFKTVITSAVFDDSLSRQRSLRQSLMVMLFSKEPFAVAFGKNTTFRAPAIIPNFTEYCAGHEKWHFNFTEYCACHEKWLSWLILVTYETLFTMRGTTDGILQHHRILRLPRKMTLQHFKEISRKQLKRHFQCGADPSMIRAGSEQDPSMKPSLRNPPRNRGYFSRPPRAFCIENTTFRAPAIIPNFTEYCACHEKWHFNFTEYCACHEKWHLNSTKQCTCHEKSHYAILYSSLVFATILLRISSQTNLISYESNLLRISSQTNLMSNASNLLRISSHKNLISYESLLKRISSQTHLISYESLLKRI